MSGRIMLVDSIATNRIVLAAKLTAAHYQVESCADPASAAAALAVACPDLILIDMTDPTGAAADFCAALRASKDTAALPVIATGVFADVSGRLAALRAGADDVLDKPVSDVLLLARVRSLLRRRASVAELYLRDDTHRALGFADAALGFVEAGPGLAEAQGEFVAAPPVADGARPLTRPHQPGMERVVVVTRSAQPRPAGVGPVLGQLCAHLPGGCVVSDAEAVLADTATSADVFILVGADDGAGGPGGAGGLGVPVGALFRLVADLRSRSVTRHCDLLVLLPQGQSEMAAMALDLGASDVVTGPVTAEELDMRVRALLRQKSRDDRMRATLREGLEAAVTDSLTGLYNRRYALPHLARMADRAAATGRDFALMVLDIDHFKRINDTHGHAAGDRVLAEVARRLQANLRGIDLVARIGGEEFLVAMPDTTFEQARATAERLRRAVNDAPFAVAGALPAAPDTIRPMPLGSTMGSTLGSTMGSTMGGPGRLTVSLSIGVALGSGGEAQGADIQALLARADTALYAAKTAGRNMVTISQTAA